MNNIKYIKERSQGIAKYSDKLRDSIRQIDNEMSQYFKDAGITTTDDEFEYEDNYGNVFQLVICKTEYGQYAGQWGIYLSDGQEEIWVGDASRLALKQVVKRIIPLFEKYARDLEQFEVEYKEIADKTEAMTEAIKGH
jgi:hypothetical protein